MRRTPVGCKLRGREVKTLRGMEHLINERGTAAVSAPFVWETMLPWIFLHCRVINRCFNTLGCSPTLGGLEVTEFYQLDLTSLEVIIDDMIVQKLPCAICGSRTAVIYKFWRQLTQRTQTPTCLGLPRGTRTGQSLFVVGGTEVGC